MHECSLIAVGAFELLLGVSSDRELESAVEADEVDLREILGVHALFLGLLFLKDPQAPLADQLVVAIVSYLLKGELLATTRAEVVWHGTTKAELVF